MSRRLLALGFVLFATLASPSVTHAQSSPTGAFCGTRTTRPPRVHPHVIWVWMENHNYVQILGRAKSPTTRDMRRAFRL